MAGADVVCVDNVGPNQRVRVRVTAGTSNGDVTTEQEFDTPEDARCSKGRGPGQTDCRH